MSIYMHFLDRELNASLSHKIDAQRIIDVLLALSITTNNILFCGLSLIFESGSQNNALYKIIYDLIQHDILIPVSYHPTIEEFLESRRVLYRHDIKRYPMYFNDKIFNSYFNELNILYKEISTTKFLIKKFQNFSAQSSINIPDQINYSNILHVINRTIENIGDKAVTYAAFRNFFLDDSTQAEHFFIRRAISCEYTKHYMLFLNADIITGIRGYEFYDFLSVNFPLFDYPLLSKFANLILLSIYNNHYSVPQLLLNRRNPNHVKLCYLISRLLTFFYKIAIVQKKLESPNQIRWFIADCIDYYVISKLNKIFSNQLVSFDCFINELLFIYQKIQQDNQYIMNSNLLEHNKTKVLICTATDIESKVIIDFLQKKGLKLYTEKFENLSFIKFTWIKNNLFLIQSLAGSSGSSGAMLTINDAIDALSPNCVISLGIAFGIDQNSQNIGDLIISTHIRNYEAGRVGSKEFIPRGDRIPANPHLLNKCNMAKLICKSKYKIHMGVILSGEKLVDNSEFKNFLTKIEPEAVGGEMEGVGIYSSCYRKQIPWIVIKGICDWAQGKSDKFQEEAALNAIEFFWCVLERYGWDL